MRQRIVERQSLGFPAELQVTRRQQQEPTAHHYQMQRDQDDLHRSGSENIVSETVGKSHSGTHRHQEAIGAQKNPAGQYTK
ncbi:MAG: hypothetical protein ABSB15_00285 [Bryobacteraceae bacterium]